MLDERIRLQNKIIEKYESLIQAIIYKTKTNGITKGSWQKMELSKVLHERNEKNIDGRTICSVSVSQGVVNQVEYLGRSFAAQQTNHYNVVKYGDIVYTKSPTGDFPYGIIKRSDIEEDVAVSPLYGVYTPSNDNIGVILHFYFMKPSNAFNYLHPLIQKGAKNTINITNLRFLENFVPLPISENEAYTIATTLKTIQKKIDIVLFPVFAFLRLFICYFKKRTYPASFTDDLVQDLQKLSAFLMIQWNIFHRQNNFIICFSILSLSE